MMYKYQKKFKFSIFFDKKNVRENYVNIAYCIHIAHPVGNVLFINRQYSTVYFQLTVYNKKIKINIYLILLIGKYLEVKDILLIINKPIKIK